MISKLVKAWFLLALVPLIVLGIAAGSHFADGSAAHLVKSIPSAPVTAAILFVMSFSLNSGQLAAAFRAPAPVLWASLVNLGFAPAAALLLTPLQLTPDFRYGLMIAGSVPCTMAAASVWSRKAGGNDAISLLVTLLTNGVCFLVTPFWLKTMAGAGGVTLDADKMIITLLTTVLIPSVAGQLARRNPTAALVATRRKGQLGGVAQVLLLTLAFQAAWGAGERLQQTGHNLHPLPVVVVWISCIAIHLAAMAVGAIGSKWLGFTLADRTAVLFAASQKTLPIGIFLATDKTLFGNPSFLAPDLGIPFAVFPIMMFHASQLIIDTVVADRLAGKSQG